MKENELKKGGFEPLQECSYRDIIEKEELAKNQSESPSTTPPKNIFSISVVSRISFDFFSQDEKSN